MAKLTPEDVHFALGALEKKAEEMGKPPMGKYVLNNRVMQLTFPSMALVTRAEGTNKDGTNAGKDIIEPPLEITPGAMRRYILRVTEAEVKSPAKAKILMATCLREDLEEEDERSLPAWAVEALAVVQAEQPVVAPLPGKPKPTPADRTGDKEVKIEMLTVKKSQAVKKHAVA